VCINIAGAGAGGWQGTDLRGLKTLEEGEVALLFVDRIVQLAAGVLQLVLQLLDLVCVLDSLLGEAFQRPLKGQEFEERYP